MILLYSPQNCDLSVEKLWKFALLKKQEIP